MRLLADENVARDIVVWLRGMGHDVLAAAEVGPGTPDPDWAACSHSEQRVVLTSDKDFGELVYRDARPSHGIILLRLDDLPVSDALARLKEVWSVVEANPVGKFIVVTEKRVRVRPLPSSQNRP